MLLSITYRVPSLSSMQVDGMEEAIRKGFGIMRIWEENPSVGAAVRRFSALIRRVGIDLEDGNNDRRYVHST
jgi:hypothetical protein